MIRALTVAGIPNLIAWTAIIALYYDGSPTALLQDAATGAYSMSHYGVGNALGGANQKGFLDLAEIFSLPHLKGIFALAVLYSPFLLVGFAASLVHRPAERLRGLMRSDGMFFLAMLVPYMFYGFGWEPGLGYVNDWDLFSHVTIFGLGVIFVAATAAPSNRVFAGVLLAGSLGSAVLTTYVVLESRRSDTPPGVHAVITSLGVSSERIAKRRSGAAGRSKKSTKPPNVLLYVVDTLRADALSPYGNETIDTPAIQEFADDAIVFERAYASSSWTRPSMASLLTGLDSESHGVEERGDLLDEQVTLLAERFAAAGYATGCIIANPNIGPYFGFDRGYDSFIELYEVERDRERDAAGRVPAREFITRSDVVTQRAIEWIESARAPFFLLVLSVDPHTPYDPPKGFDRFAEGAARDVERATLQINREGISDAERGRARSLYDGEVSFNDTSFGALIDNLRATNRYDNTIIVFTSDHGEEFWEHGTRGHGRNLFEETIRVPLIIRSPHSRERGVRRTEPVHSVDLYPTLLALASLPAAESIDGRKIGRQSEGTDPAGEPRPIHTRLRLEDRRWRSVILHPWKLVVDDTSGIRLLFHLERDPGETHDLSRERPKQLERLTALLAERETTLDREHDSSYPDDLPESARDALRALGYVEDVEEVDGPEE